MSKESIRTFIALEIDQTTKEKIIEFQNKIKQTQSIKASWVESSRIHLTLKFLGDTRLKNIEEIKDTIKECFKNTKAINCTLTKIGAFPNEKFPRVVWVGIEEGRDQIIDLSIKLENSLSELGFKKEKREFKTHITICRAKQLLDYGKFSLTLNQINETFKPIEFILNKIIFFESKLTQKGPIYTDLFNHLLQ